MMSLRWPAHTAFWSAPSSPIVRLQSSLISFHRLAFQSFGRSSNGIREPNFALPEAMLFIRSIKVVLRQMMLETSTVAPELRNPQRICF
jgi:hypothetical protein